MTTQVDKTKEVLAAMLKEDVGCSMLDSGGEPRYDDQGNYVGSNHGYGRGFEKIKNKDLDKLPVSCLRFSHRNGEIDIEAALSTYHWLQEKLDFDPVIDGLWKQYLVEHEDEDKADWELMEGFPGWLKEHPWVEEVRGLLDRGTYEAINSYNGPSMLDGVIQWFPMQIKLNSDKWTMTRILLQTHNGCDVRGGYSDPRAFIVLDGEWLMNSDATISCEHVAQPGQGKMFEGCNDEPHRWRTDDAYRFHPDEHDGKELHEYIGTYDLSLKGDGEHLAIDEETHEGYCPICGAKLALYS